MNEHWRGDRGSDRDGDGDGSGNGSGRRDRKENDARDGNSAPASNADRSDRADGDALALASDIGGGGPGQRVFSDAFTIGRSRRCDLLIATNDDTRTISKVHARIFPMRETMSGVVRTSQQKWILQDLDTLNGTAINGMDLMPGGTMELHDGDEIVLSSTMRSGVRLRVQFPRADLSRVVVKLVGTNSPRHSGFGALAPPPVWNGSEPARAAMVAAPSRASPVPKSTSTKRERPSDVDATKDNAEIASAAVDATHQSQDKKRLRKDDIDEKERFMVCSVCLDYFHDSATLACSHTFCGYCISHWFRTSSSLSCPECRGVVKHLPVRNRALDDLVHKLVGDSDAYKAVIRKRATLQSPSPVAASSSTSMSSAAAAFDVRTHPLVFTRWSPDAMLSFSTFMGRQFGDHRVSACRQVGLTEAAVDSASAAELLVAAQNLLIDCMSLRAFHEASDRLKIYLHFG